jgi:hypothetical protein
MWIRKMRLLNIWDFLYLFIRDVILWSAMKKLKRIKKTNPGQVESSRLLERSFNSFDPIWSDASDDYENS